MHVFGKSAARLQAAAATRPGPAQDRQGPSVCAPSVPPAPQPCPPAALRRPQPRPGAELSRQQQTPFSAAPARSNKAALLFLLLLKHNTKQHAHTGVHTQMRPPAPAQREQRREQHLPQPCAQSPLHPSETVLSVVTLSAVAPGRRRDVWASLLRAAGLLPRPLPKCPSFTSSAQTLTVWKCYADRLITSPSSSHPLPLYCLPRPLPSLLFMSFGGFFAKFRISSESASPPSSLEGDRKKPQTCVRNNNLICKEKSLEWGLIVTPLGSRLNCWAFFNKGANCSITPVGSSSTILLNHDRQIA